jgi:hypothetical protein
MSDELITPGNGLPPRRRMWRKPTIWRNRYTAPILPVKCPIA